MFILNGMHFEGGNVDEIGVFYNSSLDRLLVFVFDSSAASFCLNNSSIASCICIGTESTVPMTKCSCADGALAISFRGINVTICESLRMDWYSAVVTAACLNDGSGLVNVIRDPVAILLTLTNACVRVSVYFVSGHLSVRGRRTTNQ